MISKNRKFNRRSLLRGAIQGSTVVIGLPILESFLNNNGTAYADGTELPPCFGSWFFGLGLTPGRWEPKVIGSNYELPEHIAALKPIREKLNIFSGLQIYLDGKVNQNHISGAHVMAMPAPVGPQEVRMAKRRARVLPSSFIVASTAMDLLTLMWLILPRIQK